MSANNSFFGDEEMIELNMSYEQAAKHACETVFLAMHEPEEVSQAIKWVVPFIRKMAKICDEVEREKKELENAKRNPWQ
jgi:hypothetical protein